MQVYIFSTRPPQINIIKNKLKSGCGGLRLSPALGRQRQVDLRKFDASLVYIASSKLPELHSETLPQKKGMNK